MTHQKVKVVAKTVTYVLCSFLAIGYLGVSCHQREKNAKKRQEKESTEKLVQELTSRRAVTFYVEGDKPLKITPTSGKKYDIDSDFKLIVKINDEKPHLYDPLDPKTWRRTGYTFVQYTIWSYSGAKTPIVYSEY